METLPRKKSGSRLAGKRVVICEDDGLTSLQLSQGLTLCGMVVIGRTLDGLETVQLVERERPDIVLMDVNVVGIDGVSAAQRILALSNRVCIVMITAFADEDSIQRGRAMGIRGWVIKPITTAEMIARLEEAWAAFEEENPER